MDNNLFKDAVDYGMAKYCNDFSMPFVMMYKISQLIVFLNKNRDVNNYSELVQLIDDTWIYEYEYNDRQFEKDFLIQSRIVILDKNFNLTPTISTCESPICHIRNQFEYITKLNPNLYTFKFLYQWYLGEGKFHFILRNAI